MRVKEFLNYEVRAKNLSSFTVRNYRRHVTDFYVWLNGQDIDNAEPQQIIDFLMSMRERGLSPSSCNLYLQSLRCYYDYCVRFHGLAMNPAVRVEKMKTPKLLPLYVQEYKMEYLFKHVLVGQSFKSLRSRAVIAFFYMTGARCAEVSVLKDADIDFRENRIYIMGKGRKQRVVPMCQKLRAILLQYMAIRDARFGAHSMGLFVNVNNGAPLSDWEIRTLTKAALLKVVSRDLAHPHILRHTFATILMNHGKAIQDISRWLGHTSIAVTQRYLSICANPAIDNFETIF